MKVEIISTVHHDGKTLEVGSKPDLPADVAEALVKAGAAVEAGKAKAQAKADAAADDKPAE